MKDFLKNPAGARLVLILVIILATIFSCHRSLTKNRTKIEATIITGSDGSGTGINSDIEKRIDYARDITKITAKYTELSSETERVEEAYKALQNRGETAGEISRLNSELTEITEKVYEVSESILTETDYADMKWLMDNLSSWNDTINREAAKYNEKATEYNNILNTFPTNLLKYPAFIKECELFGQ